MKKLINAQMMLTNADTSMLHTNVLCLLASLSLASLEGDDGGRLCAVKPGFSLLGRRAIMLTDVGEALHIRLQNIGFVPDQFQWAIELVTFVIRWSPLDVDGKKCNLHGGWAVRIGRE